MVNLTPKQLQDAAELRRTRRFSYTKSRYSVMTPQQYREFAKECDDGNRRRHEISPRRELLMKKRHHAKHRGIEFTICEEDLEWPLRCPVTGIVLHYGGRSQGGVAGKRGARRDAATFDRIDNTKGYVPGNVVIVSYWVNARKGDATPDQLRLIAEFYSVNHNCGSDEQAYRKPLSNRHFSHDS